MAQNFDIKFRGDASSAERAMDALNRGMDKVGSGAMKAAKLIGGIGAAVGAAVGATAGAGLSRADQIRRASLISEQSTGDIQRLTFATRDLDFEGAGDILATLSEGIADALEGVPDRVAAFAKMGISQADLKGKSTFDVFKMMGRGVSAGSVDTPSLEQGLQMLSLGDESRYLKPLLRGDTEKLLEMANKFVSKDPTLDELEDINSKVQGLKRGFGKFASEATALGSIAYQEAQAGFWMHSRNIMNASDPASRADLAVYKEQLEVLKEIRQKLSANEIVGFVKK